MALAVFTDPDPDTSWVPGSAAPSTTVFAAGSPRVVVEDAIGFAWGGGSAPLYADNIRITATYDAVLARVQLAGTGLDPFTLVTVERSTDLVRWTTVRGGTSAAVVAGAVALDDYEFADNVINYYRLRTLAPFGQTSDRTSITPSLGDTVWIKSVNRPFLNRAVTVLDWSDIARPAAGNVFEPVGRSLPIAITDVRGSRSWTLPIRTGTPAERQTMDYILASGDVLFIHVPAGCEVPGGYVVVDTTSERRPAMRGTPRVFTLPVREVAPPGPDVVGATSTWATVLAAYATWADVLAAHPTWSSLLAMIGDPSEVIVP